MHLIGGIMLLGWVHFQTILMLTGIVRAGILIPRYPIGVRGVPMVVK